jgi:hypothetical protein
MSGRQLRRTAGVLACVAAGALATATPSLAGETAVGLTTDAPSGLVTFPLDAPGSAQSAVTSKGAHRCASRQRSTPRSTRAWR